MYWLHYLWCIYHFGNQEQKHWSLLTGSIYNVYQARSAQRKATLPLFLQWTPLVLFTGPCYLWLASPYSSILSDNHLVLFALILSLIFGRMTTKIILVPSTYHQLTDTNLQAHLTLQPFPYFTVMLIPLMLGALLVNLPYLGSGPISAATELQYAWATLAVSGFLYFHWAFSVIDNFTSYLGINCLTIPVRRQD